MLSKNPLVSIIIPTYNRAGVISETLESVLLQTYQHWECIIIDDRSNDNSVEIIDSYVKKDPRFTFIVKNKGQKKGASASRNIGLDNSKGDYIQFLDSDDLLHSEKIEIQVAQLNENDRFTISTCKWERFESLIEEIKEFYNKADYRNFDDTGEYFKTIGKYGGFFPPEVFLISRDIINFSGFWNESLTNNDDGEFFFRIISNASKIIFEEKAIVYHRKVVQGNENLSELDSHEKLYSLINSWKIIEALYVVRYKDENSDYINKKKEAVYNSLKQKYKFIIEENNFFFKNQIKHDNLLLKLKKLIKKIKLRLNKHAGRI
ncbi:glycosyltransferase family A protein [Flavobacterium piscis]|uniref:Glycosyltransferase involved in cell wall biosynthesis n=1 Tax=Flavobacterium piscis TaxID=1114874 RepID=A0ABU1Y3Z6_9FLAO|nr:glycosyltransferase family A protein [Flavobacterium piscis]MDR7208954.1 glycosyltransferase involved in cell wall biosynthesis [Flavobacterium piscis]